MIIWAYGLEDEVGYHMKRRGNAPVYLLDPQISDEQAHAHYRQIGPHSNLYLVQRWALTSTVRLAPKPTTVWCSVQRGPRLLVRHDIVGVSRDLYLPVSINMTGIRHLKNGFCRWVLIYLQDHLADTSSKSEYLSVHPLSRRMSIPSLNRMLRPKGKNAT